MADYPVGFQLRAVIRTKDTNGQLADATAVTFTYTKPDTTTTTPTVTHDTTGIYHCDQSLSAAGTWAWAEASTGLVTVLSGTFTVA